MTIRKIADIIIRASPNGRSTVSGSGIKFYSYDKNSAAIDFHIQDQDGSPTDLFNVDVKLMLLTKESDEWKQFTAFDGVEIISGLDGHARYVIPDELRGYQGIVEGYVYLDFNDDSRSDECYFNFTIERSRIEEEFEHAGEYYIKEIQDSIDETIAELKKYAAEKLKEYDKQFSALNTQITNTKDLADSLANQTTVIQSKQAEILKLIADNNVATKADLEEAKKESSANVVYQVSGDESALVPERLLVDGIEGFAVRNVDGTINPFNQSDYDNLKNGITTGTETTTSGKPAQFEFSFDLIAYTESKYPYLFSGLTSTSAKLIKLKSALKSIKIPHTARGATSSNFDWWNYQAGAWAGVNFSNTTTGFVEKIYEINSITDTTFSRLFGNTGVFKSRIYSGFQSDGIQKSWIELKDFSLIVELELSAKEIIDYTIAANHVENLATQLEAETGTDNTKTMTPLRVFQAITKWTKDKFVNKTGDETISGAKNFMSAPLVNSVAVAKSDNVLNLIDPQSASGLKNFKNGIQLNGLNVASEFAKAVDTDKYNQKGAVYLGGNAWIAWETLTFQNASGYVKGSYIRLGSDSNIAFTYPDVKNPIGGYIWLGGACQPDYTDGGFGSYNITIENNFDDARKPIVRFVDSPTTPVKKLAVRGVALIFAPAPTENSKI